MIQEMIGYTGADGPIQAYLARPDTQDRRPAVIVIHEIWGLSEHIQDVARRFADQGYVALAPNLYSRPELSEVMRPDGIRAAMRFMNSVGRERMGDREHVEQELSKLPADERAAIETALPAMSGAMPRHRMYEDLVRAVDYLNQQPYVIQDKIASIGFCFGGGMSGNLACRAPMAASVVFYGENPDPLDLVQNIAGPVLGIYGAEDLRINNHLPELVGAMVKYKKPFEMKIYTGAAHAFFNDTNPATYRPAQAKDAWERVLRFFQHNLLEA